MAYNDVRLHEQLERSIERHMGLWKYKICDKTSTDKSKIKRHAETHVEGETRTCNICRINFATSNSLSGHIAHIHSSKLYSCTGCGKMNMNKMTGQKKGMQVKCHF